MTTFAYADPPYPGQSAKHYADHPDFAGEVDHGKLVGALVDGFTGWALSTHVSGLYECQQHLASYGLTVNKDYRVMAWVKPFAAFKRNVKVAYTWEPVIVHTVRPAEPNRIDSIAYRDHIAESITMKRDRSSPPRAPTPAASLPLLRRVRDRAHRHRSPGTLLSLQREVRLMDPWSIFMAILILIGICVIFTGMAG